jgi:ADP-heptose:LPS heptosyltransferase
MKTIVTIDGGIGRALTALPALLYFAEKHKEEEFYFMIHGWDFLSWGFPQLQGRTFNPEIKGTFEKYFWDADKVIVPEPYKIPEYYRGEISLIQAFHQEINGTKDYENLTKNYFKLSQFEDIKGNQIIHEVKELQKKSKTIVVQPYGSTANRCPMGIFDPTFRSIPQKFYENLVNKLSKNYNIIFMGAHEHHDSISYKPQPDPNMREWIGIIKNADYFIGCDTCGQHFAKAMGKKASVVIAGTHKNNVSYPEDFHIIERDCEFYPAPMRICNTDSSLATRLNEERIMFTDEEIEIAYNEIVKRIEEKNEETVVERKIQEVSKKIGSYV